MLTCLSAAKNALLCVHFFPRLFHQSRCTSSRDLHVRNCSASLTTNLPPTPKAAAPARMNEPAVSRFTPPVGTRGTCGKRPLQRFQVASPSHLGTREDLHEIRVGLPRRHHLGRSKRTRHHHHPLAHGVLHSFEIKSWTHQKLRSCVQTLPGHLHVQDASRSCEHLGKFTNQL